MAALLPLTQFQEALQWIGFDRQNQRDSLEAEIGNLDAFVEFTNKDIRDLRDSYAGRTIAGGRIHFGMQHTKKLQSIAEWVKDLARIGETPNINGLTWIHSLNPLLSQLIMLRLEKLRRKAWMRE